METKVMEIRFLDLKCKITIQFAWYKLHLWTHGHQLHSASHSSHSSLSSSRPQGNIHSPFLGKEEYYSSKITRPYNQSQSSWIGENPPLVLLFSKSLSTAFHVESLRITHGDSRILNFSLFFFDFFWSIANLPPV